MGENLGAEVAYEEAKEMFRSEYDVKELPDLEITECSKLPDCSEVDFFSIIPIDREQSYEDTKSIKFQRMEDGYVDEENSFLAEVPYDFHNPVDREDYKIKVSRKDLEEYSEEFGLRDTFLALLMENANLALEESIEPVERDVKDRYDHIRGSDTSLDQCVFSPILPNGRFDPQKRTYIANIDDIDHTNL
ncbi:MAG: hypothetical protein ABEJ72_11385, partial [Candidatus Aenigmatarchaeota archaeon]